MKRNILALYIIKLSKWFTLVMPIIVLFYEDHGLGLQDVFILKSVYSIAAVALEIPSDIWPTCGDGANASSSDVFFSFLDISVTPSPPPSPPLS